MNNQPNNQAPEENIPGQKAEAFPPIKAEGWSIMVYTDPLCVWSWAMRAAWLRFLSSFEPIEVTYRMAGLLPSWSQFADHQNAISKPIQMGPEWAHARAISRAFIDDKIWVVDPPASSYPACIAVKAAALQGRAAGEQYFYLTQKAVMTGRKNIAKTAVLQQLAEELKAEAPEFDADRFASDLTGAEARRLFRLDSMDWKYLQAGRLPAMIFKHPSGRGVLLTGYQTSETLHRGIASLL